MCERLNRRTAATAAAVFALAAVLALILHWPALTDPQRMHDNWRQVPHWTPPSTWRYVPGDPFFAYAVFNTSPVANGLYQGLARLFGGGPIWGKVNAILFFAVSVMLVFLVGRTHGDTRGGLVAAGVYAFLPCMFKHFSGGFMNSLSTIFLCATLLLVCAGDGGDRRARRWWWGVPLLFIAALTYPCSAVHGGLLLALAAAPRLWRARRDRRVWIGVGLPLLTAAMVGAAVLTAKYQFAPAEYGELADRHVMRDRVEFTDAGRYPLLPVRPLWDHIARKWGDPFHIGLFLLAYFWLGTGVFRWPAGIRALLASSLLLYALADIFAMRLYIPERYTLHALPLFAALVAGGWWSALLAAARRGDGRAPSGRQLAVCAVILAVVGLWQFRRDLRPGVGTRRYSHAALHAAVRALPGRPLIAVHPRRGSEIPLFTGKSVFVSRELSHPWWSTYWAMVDRRTRDFFTAYYTRDPAVLRQFITRYSIDYWIVQPRHFTRRYLRRKRRFYMQPYDRWLRHELHPSGHALLARVPRRLRRPADNDHYLVASADLLAWLDGLSEREERP